MKNILSVEFLKTYLDNLEESYDRFFRKTVETTTYAEEAIDSYESPFNTDRLFLDDLDSQNIRERLNSALEEVQDYSSNVEDDLFTLSMELQEYSNFRDTKNLPEKYWGIDERLSEIREHHKEQKAEIEQVQELLDDNHDKEEPESDTLEPQTSSHQLAEGKKA